MYFLEKLKPIPKKQKRLEPSSSEVTVSLLSWCSLQASRNGPQPAPLSIAAYHQQINTVDSKQSSYESKTGAHVRPELWNAAAWKSSCGCLGLFAVDPLEPPAESADTRALPSDMFRSCSLMFCTDVRGSSCFAAGCRSAALFLVWHLFNDFGSLLLCWNRRWSKMKVLKQKLVWLKYMWRFSTILGKAPAAPPSVSIQPYSPMRTFFYSSVRLLGLCLGTLSISRTILCSSSSPHLLWTFLDPFLPWCPSTHELSLTGWTITQPDGSTVMIPAGQMCSPQIFLEFSDWVSADYASHSGSWLHKAVSCSVHVLWRWPAAGCLLRLLQRPHLPADKPDFPQETLTRPFHGWLWKQPINKG